MIAKERKRENELAAREPVGLLQCGRANLRMSRGNFRDQLQRYGRKRAENKLLYEKGASKVGPYGETRGTREEKTREGAQSAFQCSSPIKKDREAIEDKTDETVKSCERGGEEINEELSSKEEARLGLRGGEAEDCRGKGSEIRITEDAK